MIKNGIEFFPDGTEIDEWFYRTEEPYVSDLGKAYLITDYGAIPSGQINTQSLQSLIDLAYSKGGGVIVVPKGVFYTGALWFKQGVHLYLEEGAVLKGSDDISDYPVCDTRIEGESCKYFPALINADGVDGFTIFGKGIIDGNGEKSWKAFWRRREWNPSCTNKDEQRARLIFISNSKNVLISGLRLQNSQFWTNHIYKCSRVKFINCSIFSPKEPVLAPSTDAIDIDACRDVLVKNCYMEVNDDAVVLKGGKGPWADESEENGSNERILVEDCAYGFCHSGLTLGSECIHTKNVIVRRIKVNGIMQFIHFKLRPDTPQRYEYVKVEDAEGSILGSFININPWTQFFDLKGRTDKSVSVVENIEIKNCKCRCGVFFNVSANDKEYKLKNFKLENITVEANDSYSGYEAVENLTLNGVEVR